MFSRISHCCAHAHTHLHCAHLTVAWPLLAEDDPGQVGYCIHTHTHTHTPALCTSGCCMASSCRR